MNHDRTTHVSSLAAGGADDRLEAGGFLPDDPPPLLLRGIAWLLISVFFVVALAALLVEIPETVRCPFLIVSEAGASSVESPYSGTIRRVEVLEGQEVASGQALFVIGVGELREMRTELESFRVERDHLETMIEDREAFHRRMEDLKAEEIRLWAARMESLGVDAGTGVDGGTDGTTDGTRIAETDEAAERNRLRRKLTAARLERERDAGAAAVEMAGYRLRLGELAVRIDSLERQLTDADGDEYHVRAPFRGTVLSVYSRVPGQLVRPGNELCQLARRQGRTFARLRLERQAALARLNGGQSVRFFFEAFPYQRHGSVGGRLAWISPTAVATPTGAVFHARATLNDTTIGVAGVRKPLQVGMRGEARVLVGSRTPLEFVFEPLLKLRENMRQ